MESKERLERLVETVRSVVTGFRCEVVANVDGAELIGHLWNLKQPKSAKGWWEVQMLRSPTVVHRCSYLTEHHC